MADGHRGQVADAQPDQRRHQQAGRGVAAPPASPIDQQGGVAVDQEVASPWPTSTKATSSRGSPSFRSAAAAAQENGG